MTARPWTAAEKHDLVRWYAGGMTIANIARALDRTMIAVKHRCTALGLTRRRVPSLPVTPEEAAAARAELRAQCAAARAERASAVPYRNGPLQW